MHRASSVRDLQVIREGRMVIAWSRLTWWKAGRKIHVIVEKSEEKDKFGIAVARGWMKLKRRLVQGPIITTWFTS